MLGAGPAAMRIDSIYLRDVGPFDEVTIPFPEGKDPNLADVYLLTGPNGCGKSTVLYAIAAAFREHLDVLGPTRIFSRMRTDKALAAIRMSDEVLAVTTSQSVVTNPFDHTRMGPASIRIRENGLRHLRQANSGRRRDQATYGSMFTYAGSRSTQDVHVLAIQEMTDHPLQNSLAFEQASDTSKLVHWIANQEFKRLKAQNRGDADEAAALYRSILDIEAVVGEIVEDPTFRFVHGNRDNDVRICWQGKQLDFGVLPAGLQSIVSWVADLLMRLDRSKWTDGTPPLLRPFMLLLDEIDVHLHPEWQRKVLPAIQKLFPNAQIIATTHSPFVVASADDAHVIRLELKNGVSSLASVDEFQSGQSYRSVLQGIFGLKTEFDVATEKLFEKFYVAKAHLFEDGTSDRTEVDQIARELASRGEEVADIIGLELRQLDRQLAKRAAG